MMMSFRFEKLTTKAQQAVADAQNKASVMGHAEITPIHLLNSLLEETDGIVTPLLEKIDAPLKQLVDMVETEIKRIPNSTSTSNPDLSRDLHKVLESSAQISESMQDEFISTEHLLLGLIKTEGQAKRLLDLNVVDETAVLNGLKAIRGNNRVTDQDPDVTKKYGA
jgi:ATP-dependent Clp protease ATP-binding subunit ClpB